MEIEQKINYYKKIACEHRGSVTYASGEEYGVCSECNEPVFFISTLQYEKLTTHNSDYDTTQKEEETTSSRLNKS